MLKNRPMSTRAFLLDCFLQTAKMLTMAFSSDGQVKQVIMAKPSISHQMPPLARSVIHVKIALLEARKPFLGLFQHSFSTRVLSVDRTSVSGGLFSFGASIELVKKNLPEMLTFLDLTLHSFGPKHFAPLVQIGKFQESFNRGKRKL
jgi:hypothetical protein